MKIANKHTGWMLSAMSLVAFTGGTAIADDAELFIAGEDTSSSNSEARPNILFIIDTSGSMKGEVLTETTYDPNETYSGSYSSNRIYWSTTKDNIGGNRYFAKSYNNCQAAEDALDGLGTYKGELLAHRVARTPWRSGWRQLSERARSRYVECRDDRGVHGETAGTFYAADGQTGPYATNASAEPRWNTSYYLYDGNYLNWQQSGGAVTQTRLEIVQEVTNNLIDNISDVNVGLMRFNFDDGGPVVYPMSNVNTDREAFKSAVSGLDYDTWTPLSETLYEAYLYYKGGTIDYGQGYTRNSVAGSRTGGSASATTYNSPVDFACQKNYVILLTDGEPTRDKGAQNEIEGLPGFKKATGNASCQYGAPYTGQYTEQDDGICLDELAEYMYKTDVSSEFYGDQNITTYTVGFTIDLDLLGSTATKGGGEYYLADNTSTLSAALTKITVSILDDATTFVAPVVPVNAFNRTQSLSDVYMSVFNPSSTVRWPGNLKKYKLTNSVITDANNKGAIDPSTGFFKENSQSFWSTMVDGDRPEQGGAAEQMPEYTQRKLYTNLSGGQLKSDANRISLENELLTPQETSAATDELHDSLVNWMLGLDVWDDNDDGSETDTRRQLGDSMHGSPVPVIYGGTQAEPDLVIYTTTNDGYLHAVDPDDGQELWAFAPRRLLPLQIVKYENEVSASRVYGLDGQIKAHILNNDFVGGVSADERVILVFGMRRGGNALYAVEVTDRNDPQLLWVIDDQTAGFEDLGQTWSTPEVTKVRIGNETKTVALFGGGYDTGQDADDYRTDNQGNAIYMVDLLTGDKVWSAGKAGDHDLVLEDMEHSIPAPLRLIDLNNDSFADRAYVGDMGGRVWRVDFFQGEQLADLAQGGMIASLGAADLESPTPADVRRFYSQIDAVNVQAYGNSFMALNIGSGYRAHPLDRAISEEFYSLRDFNGLRPLLNEEYGNPILRTQLTDITELPNADIEPTDPGWRLRLDESAGEKSLSSSLTSGGIVTFVTFAPGTSASACVATQGINTVYRVNLLSGDPVYRDDPEDPNSPDPNNPSPGDRTEALAQGGIVPGPTCLTDGTCCYGTKCDPPTMPPMPTRSYWTQDGAR